MPRSNVHHYPPPISLRDIADTLSANEVRALVVVPQGAAFVVELNRAVAESLAQGESSFQRYLREHAEIAA